MQPNLLSPIIQYGFAGMCAVLVMIIVWLIKKLLALLEQTNRIIAANTQVIGDVDNRTGDELKLLRQLYDKVISRPCIAARED